MDPLISVLSEKGLCVKPEFYFVTVRRKAIPFKDHFLLSIIENPAPKFIQRLFMDTYVKYEQHPGWHPHEKHTTSISKNMKHGSHEFTVKLALYPASMTVSKARDCRRYKEIAFPAARIKKTAEGYRFISGEREVSRVIRFLERLEQKLGGTSPEKICTEGFADFFRYISNVRYDRSPHYERIDKRPLPVIAFLVSVLLLFAAFYALLYLI